MSIKKFVIASTFVFFLLFPTGASAVYFGAKIISIPKPCDNFVGYYVKALKVPFGDPVNILFIPGFSKAYLYGPPSFPGQWLLGSGVPGTCDIIIGKGSNVIPGILIDSGPGVGSSK